MSDHERDEARGRIKEAAGDLTGDKDLKREGKVDRGSATAKEKVDQATEAVKDKLNRDDRQ
ncbi:MAG: CsbD family protein [Actinomycetota bacterium]|nr:CsbD family protein [Actinomycetota bacterium]